jgi:hypothetical protein
MIRIFSLCLNLLIFPALGFNYLETINKRLNQKNDGPTNGCWIISPLSNELYKNDQAFTQDERLIATCAKEMKVNEVTCKCFDCWKNCNNSVEKELNSSRLIPPQLTLLQTSHGYEGGQFKIDEKKRDQGSDIYSILKTITNRETTIGLIADSCYSGDLLKDVIDKQQTDENLTSKLCLHTQSSFGKTCFGGKNSFLSFLLNSLEEDTTYSMIDLFKLISDKMLLNQPLTSAAPWSQFTSAAGFKESIKGNKVGDTLNSFVDCGLADEKVELFAMIFDTELLKLYYSIIEENSECKNTLKPLSDKSLNFYSLNLWLNENKNLKAKILKCLSDAHSNEKFSVFYELDASTFKKLSEFLSPNSLQLIHSNFLKKHSILNNPLSDEDLKKISNTPNYFQRLKVLKNSLKDPNLLKNLDDNTMKSFLGTDSAAICKFTHPTNKTSAVIINQWAKASLGKSTEKIDTQRYNTCDNFKIKFSFPTASSAATITPRKVNATGK